MYVETNFSPIAPRVFDGENYQLWAVKMETYLEALDLWKAVEEDYRVPPLPNNPIVAQIKNHNGRKTKNQRLKHVCLLWFHQPFFQELCLLKQQKLFGIISRKSILEMK